VAAAITDPLGAGRNMPDRSSIDRQTKPAQGRERAGAMRAQALCRLRTFRPSPCMVQSSHREFLFSGTASGIRDQAAALLNQQIWCWGQDVLHPSGNYLTRVGFRRIPPPGERRLCSSVYELSLGRRQKVVLRGFGIFFADDALGGIYFPRFRFVPLYTPNARLPRPCWFEEDLPPLGRPSPRERDPCLLLLMKLLDWICDYETNLVGLLGLSYRRETVRRWANGNRIAVPAEQMATAWRKCGALIPYHFDPWDEPASSADDVGELADGLGETRREASPPARGQARAEP